MGDSVPEEAPMAAPTRESPPAEALPEVERDPPITYKDDLDVSTEASALSDDGNNDESGSCGSYEVDEDQWDFIVEDALRSYSSLSKTYSNNSLSSYMSLSSHHSLNSPHSGSTNSLSSSCSSNSSSTTSVTLDSSVTSSSSSSLYSSNHSLNSSKVSHRNSDSDDDLSFKDAYSTLESVKSNKNVRKLQSPNTGDCKDNSSCNEVSSSIYESFHTDRGPSPKPKTVLQNKTSSSRSNGVNKEQYFSKKSENTFKSHSLKPSNLDTSPSVTNIISSNREIIEKFKQFKKEKYSSTNSENSPKPFSSQSCMTEEQSNKQERSNKKVNSNFERETSPHNIISSKQSKSSSNKDIEITKDSILKMVDSKIESAVHETTSSKNPDFFVKENISLSKSNTSSSDIDFSDIDFSEIDFSDPEFCQLLESFSIENVASTMNSKSDKDTISSHKPKSLSKDKVSKTDSKSKLHKIPSKDTISKTDSKSTLVSTSSKDEIAKTDSKSKLSKSPSKDKISKTDTKSKLSKSPSKDDISKTDSKSMVPKSSSKDGISITNSKSNLSKNQSKDGISKTDSKSNLPKSSSKDEISKTLSKSNLKQSGSSNTIRNSKTIEEESNCSSSHKDSRSCSEDNEADTNIKMNPVKCNSSPNMKKSTKRKDKSLKISTDDISISKENDKCKKSKSLTKVSNSSSQLQCTANSKTSITDENSFQNSEPMLEHIESLKEKEERFKKKKSDLKLKQIESLKEKEQLFKKEQSDLKSESSAKSNISLEDDNCTSNRVGSLDERISLFLSKKSSEEEIKSPNSSESFTKNVISEDTISKSNSKSMLKQSSSSYEVSNHKKTNTNRNSVHFADETVIIDKSENTSKRNTFCKESDNSSKEDLKSISSKKDAGSSSIPENDSKIKCSNSNSKMFSKECNSSNKTIKASKIDQSKSRSQDISDKRKEIVKEECSFKNKKAHSLSERNESFSSKSEKNNQGKGPLSSNSETNIDRKVTEQKEHSKQKDKTKKSSSKSHLESTTSEITSENVKQNKCVNESRASYKHDSSKQKENSSIEEDQNKSRSSRSYCSDKIDDSGTKNIKLASTTTTNPTKAQPSHQHERDKNLIKEKSDSSKIVDEIKPHGENQKEINSSKASGSSRNANDKYHTTSETPENVVNKSQNPKSPENLEKEELYQSSSEISRSDTVMTDISQFSSFSGMSFGSSYYTLYVLDPPDRALTPENLPSSPECSPPLSRSNSNASIASIDTLRSVTPDAAYFEENDAAFRRLSGIYRSSSCSSSEHSWHSQSQSKTNKSSDIQSRLDSCEREIEKLTTTPKTTKSKLSIRSQPTSPVSDRPSLNCRANSFESISSFLNKLPRAPSSFGSISTFALGSASHSPSPIPSANKYPDRPASTDSPILLVSPEGSLRGSQESVVVYRPVPRYNSAAATDSPEPQPALLCYLGPARPYEPSIIYTDIVAQVRAEFEGLTSSLGSILSPEENQHIDELRSYVLEDEGSWSLGENFNVLFGRVFHDENIPEAARYHLVRIMAVAALKDDVILLLHQDRKDHTIMNYANKIETLPPAQQEALALFFVNMFEHLSPSEWLLYISEWSEGGQQISNIRVSTKVAVNALLHSNLKVQDLGTALMYNLATKEVKTVVFDDVAPELAMAILQYFNSHPPEELLWRTITALCRFCYASSEVPALIKMIGPEPSVFKGLSERIDNVIEEIDVKLSRVRLF